MIEQLKKEWMDSPQEKKDKISYMKNIFGELMKTKEIKCLLENSIVQEISINGEGMNIILDDEHSGIKMFINENDYEEVPISILCFGEYEKQEAEMVCRMLDYYKDESGFTVFDIGANVGFYTLNIMKNFPEFFIHSFEPGPVTYERLRKNIVLNNGDSRNAHNIGFYDRNGDLDFYYDKEGSGASSLANIRNKQTIEKISVKMEKMDEWIKTQNIDRLDFIKCDVEGSELFVFKGGIESIRKYKPIIFSEMLRKWSAKFNYHPNDIIHLLEDIGYQCYVLAEGNKLKKFGYVDEETVETNYFFLHPEVHEKLIKDLCVN